MRLHTLLTSLFILPSSSLFILLPLYIYPENNLWAPVFKAVTAHPHIEFQIIINPDSGPGASQYPDANYISGISRLNKFNNTRLIGYVPTHYAARPYENVTADIAVYAGWAQYTAANISLAGIFFDEVTDSVNQTQKTYMKNVAAYARSEIKASSAGSTNNNATVVFNPGTVIDKSYFGYCSTIVEFEDTYAAYEGQTTINKFQLGFHNKTAVVVNTMSVGAAKVKSLVQTLKKDNVGGVYFTSDCCYNAINATLLNELTAAVAP